MSHYLCHRTANYNLIFNLHQLPGIIALLFYETVHIKFESNKASLKSKQSSYIGPLSETALQKRFVIFLNFPEKFVHK